MFPEYREEVVRLCAEDGHFAKMFDRHSELDQQIKNMEEGRIPTDGVSIEHLKKEKLLLKDKLYAIVTRKP